MGAHSYRDLITHVGHKIVVVTYGDPDDPDNVAVECEDCCEVLLDFDIEYVTCKFCGKDARADTAHLHQDAWVGDECCWDERLRSTE